ncbi:hypothetical protein SASPL_156440 [Salvia splendens]|uniref:Nudix hydrolase domain-containing protein n=1 Tax=Salvia splendens TaxID=180675 RepID=A0A8X8VWQ4_SALSN|nr:hypothetical protein SASPL_156440 [Salvia splendens]
MSSLSPRKLNPRRLPPPFATPQTLSDWLRPRLAADLFGSWGVKPGTKNVHNLWLEIAEGETDLADSIPPVRTVEVVVARIVRGDGKILIESHQELSNGDVRRRDRPLSEKMKPGESVEAALYRAVREELGLGTSVEIGTLGSRNRDENRGIVRLVPESYTKKVEERASASYPGLPARYVLHTVEAEVEGLPEGEFSTEEADEHGGLDEKAVSCKKHFWNSQLSTSAAHPLEAQHQPPGPLIALHLIGEGWGHGELEPDQRRTEEVGLPLALVEGGDGGFGSDSLAFVGGVEDELVVVDPELGVGVVGLEGDLDGGVEEGGWAREVELVDLGLLEGEVGL